MPLTVEPSNPRMCHDARFQTSGLGTSFFVRLHNWFASLHLVSPITRLLSTLRVVMITSIYPRRVLLLWKGWYLCYKTLPFGWKASAYIYHVVGLASTSYICSLGVPCSQYIDSHHVGQLALCREIQESCGWSNFALAGAATFIDCSVLVSRGYFIGLS